MKVVCYHDKVLKVLLTEEDKRIRIFDEEAETTFEQAKIVWNKRFKKYLVDAPPTFNAIKKDISAANTAMYDISGYVLALVATEKLSEEELQFFNKGLRRIALMQDMEVENRAEALLELFGSIEALVEKVVDSGFLETVPEGLEFYDNEDKMSKYYLLLQEHVDAVAATSENPDYGIDDFLYDFYYDKEDNSSVRDESLDESAVGDESIEESEVGEDEEE